MRLGTLLILSLVACSGSGNGNTDETTDSGDDGVTFDDFINTTVSPTGTHDCFSPGSDWNTQTVDSTLVADYPFGGIVADFEEDEPVADANVEIWLGDAVDGAADITATSGSDGTLNIDLPSCQAMTYRVTTTDGNTKDTYEAHQIYDVPSGGTHNDSLNSVSRVTYQLIPGLLGVTIDEDKGVIAGTAFDCNGSEIEGAQVVVKDSSGNIPESLVVNYFVDSFPNRDQLHTSADGLWVAANVPEGELTVELYTYNGTDYDLIGATVVPSLADSINISNIYEGYGNGVKFPDSCLQTN